MMKAFSTIGIFLALCAAPLSAQTVTYEQDEVATTPGPIQSAVDADEMTGLKLTAFWGDYQADYEFRNLGFGFWGFADDDLTLGVFGDFDTYFALWSLNNTRNAQLTGLTFDASGSNVMFDRSIGHDGSWEGTSGSDVGYDYDAEEAYGFFGLRFRDVGGTVHYSNSVSLLGADPKLDLFRLMEVNFGGDGIPKDYFIDGLMRFDTDLATFPEGSAVPEPSSLALLAMAIGSLGVAARRRRRVN